MDFDETGQRESMFNVALVFVAANDWLLQHTKCTWSNYSSSSSSVG